MVAVSSFASHALADGPDGASAWMPGARARAALAAQPAIHLAGATSESRWRLEAAARHEPWENGGPLARLASRDAAMGAVSRANLAFEWQHGGPWGQLAASAFANRRDAGVSSAVGHGLDHLRQHDTRAATGVSLRHAAGGLTTVAAFRTDSLDAGAHWLGAQSQELGSQRRDETRQSSALFEARYSLPLARGLEATFGTRLQSWRFHVASDLAGRGGSGTGFVAAPHARLDLALGARTRVFAQWGTEDERGARVAQDPRTRSPLGVLDPNADATAFTAGVRTAWGRGLETVLSATRAGTRREVFLSGSDAVSLIERPASRGIARLGARWQALPGLTLDAEASWLDARFEDGRREAVPGVAKRTATAGATVRPTRGWTASLFVSHFASDGLEDEGERLRSSTLVNGRLNWSLSRRTRLSFDVFNIFDQSVGPIDYYAASRLWGQPGMADDFLFHPAEPRGFRLRLRTTF